MRIVYSVFANGETSIQHEGMETDTQTCVCILRPNVGWLWLPHLTEREIALSQLLACSRVRSVRHLRWNDRYRRGIRSP